MPVNYYAFLNIQASSFRVWVNPTLHWLISTAIGWWVTFVPAKSPFLPERNMLCIIAIEYNSNVSNGNIVVDFSFIVKIQQILCLYMYGYQNIKTCSLETVLLLTRASVNAEIPRLPWSVYMQRVETETVGNVKQSRYMRRGYQAC